MYGVLILIVSAASLAFGIVHKLSKFIVAADPLSYKLFLASAFLLIMSAVIIIIVTVLDVVTRVLHALV
jgi:hypothetical protein